MFIVHGEETAAVEFAERVKNKVGFDALAPYSGDAYVCLPKQIAQESGAACGGKKTQASAKSGNGV